MTRSLGTSIVMTAALLLACASAASARTIEINILYVHGVKNCTTERQNAHNSLTSLAGAIDGQLSSRIATWQTVHPGNTVVVNQAHDSNNKHAATFWWKTRSLPTLGPDLAYTLP